MKFRASTLIMLAVWVATFVVFILVRPGHGADLPGRVITLLTPSLSTATTVTTVPAPAN